MIGIDTNVIVRYIVSDDARQAARAAQLLEIECNAERPGFLSQIVLCELVWVLRGYGYQRADIASVLEQIMHIESLHVEMPNEVRQAIALYRSGSADFADCLIGLRHANAGCQYTATFDRNASRLASHELLSL